MPVFSTRTLLSLLLVLARAFAAAQSYSPNFTSASTQLTTVTPPFISFQGGNQAGVPLEGSVAHIENSLRQNLGIWISPQELAQLPTSGPAWENLLRAANQAVHKPDLSDQNDDTNVIILAKALVYARLQQEQHRHEVVAALRAIISENSEQGGRSLALGRELLAYVIAADLIDLRKHNAALDNKFRNRLAELRAKTLKGRTLISTHEERANNWGTHAGASRIAIAAYLQDEPELKRCAQVFRGWLGERETYAGFKFGDLIWQADSTQPVGINPKGAQRNGHVIDGVLPEEQRRAGGFMWPPQKENYVYEALQGALAQAVLLHRAGYDVWHWSDRALLRAFQWLYEEAHFPARGDDAWLVYLINHFYHTDFQTTPTTTPGKNAGWTDWTHGQSTSP